MKLPYFHVDAFASEVFRGNPAGVCPLKAWLPDAVLQAIAAENNLSETAFTVPRGSEYELRWFTPTMEMDLCGHATLASAFVLAGETSSSPEPFRFHTRSGLLEVSRNGEVFTLNFPSRPAVACVAPEPLISGLGAKPLATLKARDYLAVFAKADEVRALHPDFARLRSLDCLGIIATAPGDDCDFVSRFFAPGAGVDEDPVTGSAHCTLIPYWAAQTGRTRLHARQVSARGGELACELAGDRVLIGGRARLYLRGEICVPD